jgi:sulfur relay (sulfurtransferase) complex TusBCD TusD component (DsrE family)
MTLTLLIKSSPYSGEDALTAMKVAGAALDTGHKVNVVASGDGVYCFLKGQKARGFPNAEEGFSGLIGRGLKVYL